MFKQVFLPKTKLNSHVDLNKLELEILEYWDKINLFKKKNERNNGRQRFLLHWGPPYANGHLHMGHGLNAFLKDVVSRWQEIMGFDSVLRIGWDCHGLPIEWKVEESFRENKINKEQISTIDFRKECRDFANKWIDIQKKEFKRLGVAADWDSSYYTMDHACDIAKAIHEFVQKDLIIEGLKPVMWSVVEKTALAEAEIEYKMIKSEAATVLFPAESNAFGIDYIPIWTTTIWSLPANRALAYGEDLLYIVGQFEGKNFLVAENCLTTFFKGKKFTIIQSIKGTDLSGLQAKHPWYGVVVPMLPGEHVIDDSGTGIVHIAPEHGVEDFALAKKFGLEIPCTVDEAGFYLIDSLKGQHIFKVVPKIIELLGNNLWHLEQYEHSYPHSWRSKAKLIYRTTRQWFIDLKVFKDKALHETEKVKWFPKSAKNRICAMVNNRDEWCISRQRLWGVPLAFFIDPETRQILKDPEIFNKIYQVFKTQGVDVWFENPKQFLPEKYKNYQPIMDIVDVWFDSGCSHRYVMNSEQSDLFLEGSDQHRGWFQSSLLIGTALLGKAPYKSVLTHGYLVDHQGFKLSKSAGNALNLQDIVTGSGAEILRLWAVSVDYSDDIKIGTESLELQKNIYKRFRNTLRYLLGALEDHLFISKLEEYSMDKFSFFEKWILARLALLEKNIKELYLPEHNYQKIYQELFYFCNEDLSRFYFDIRKDLLYCGDGTLKKQYLSVLAVILDKLLEFLKPVLCFSCEEVFRLRYPNSLSVHLFENTIVTSIWYDPEILQKMDELFVIRSSVHKELEKARAQKLIGSSLDAVVLLKQKNPAPVDFCWEEFLIVSKCTWTAEMEEELKVAALEQTRCERCWKRVDLATDALCQRCFDMVEE